MADPTSITHTQILDQGLVFALRNLGISSKRCEKSALLVWELHNRLEMSGGRQVHGLKWTYQSYANWLDYFPLWSLRTAKRVVAGLLASGVVLRIEENSAAPLYRLDYLRLLEVMRAAGYERSYWMPTREQIEGGQLSADVAVEASEAVNAAPRTNGSKSAAPTATNGAHPWEKDPDKLTREDVDAFIEYHDKRRAERRRRNEGWQ